MNLQRFIVILVLVVGMGLMVTYQHARVIHSGYELSRLNHDKDALVERQRALAAEMAELKRPEVVQTQARRWQLELVPGPGPGTVVVSDKRTVAKAGQR